MGEHGKHTPGPWTVGTTFGQHLEHGEDTCRMCGRDDMPLLKTERKKTGNPSRFSDEIHHHLKRGVPEDDYPGFRTIIAQDGTCIVGNYDYEEGGVCTSWADAALIARAPDMDGHIVGLEAQVKSLEGAAAEMEAQRDELTAASIAYDDAIRACGNDPDTMASYCTAEGDTLDSLYFAWMSKARDIEEATP